MKSAKLIRRSLFVAVLGLVLTAFSSFGGAGSAAPRECCSTCVRDLQEGRRDCGVLIEQCGADWLIDPCEVSPGALCACATNCDSGC